MLPTPLAGLKHATCGLAHGWSKHPLHALVNGGGFELRTAPPYDWHGLRRGETEWALWQYTVSGCGQLTWEGRELPVGPGTAMLLAIPHDHRYRLPPGGRWEHFYLCLGGREVLAAWRAAIRRRGPLLALAPDHPAVMAAAQTTADALAGRLASPFAASATAYRLSMLVLEAALGQDAVGEVPAGIARAAALARERACLGIGVDDLARAAGLSRHHFTRRFAAAMGVSPGAYLADQRLARAARLLRDDPRARILDAARAAGHPDPAYFCRAFRRAYGCSPGDYRAMAAR